MTETIHPCPETPSAGWLIAAHLLLCLSQLPWHLGRFPLGQSLFFWWISPLDAIALGGVTLLYLKAARWGFCLNTLISGMEAAALVYLGAKTLAAPIDFRSPGAMPFFSAAAVLARIPIGWYIALTLQPARPLPRGCEP